ncbi:UNVERIFIED_CONTAM: hypothetical protein K2H54_023330 [Gekko kuhli]
MTTPNCLQGRASSFVFPASEDVKKLIKSWRRSFLPDLPMPAPPPNTPQSAFTKAKAAATGTVPQPSAGKAKEILVSFIVQEISTMHELRLKNFSPTANNLGPWPSLPYRAVVQAERGHFAR